MTDSWTDARLDDFAKHVDQRFDEVDRRFEAVDRRLEALERRMEDGFNRVNDRLDGMHRAMVHGTIAFSAAILVGYGALISFLATQL